MTEHSCAVFLSYASQDAGAARRICESLRAAGIEVWFDQSELRGGDAWDRKIREQIRDCRLFVPVISANTDHREEGYFRREWRLAVERAGDMTHRRAFLVPVVIDGTSERSAAVPEKFLELQWTRLPGGETTPAFVERVRRLTRAAEMAGTAEARPSDAAHGTAAGPGVVHFPDGSTASRAPGPWGLGRRRSGMGYAIMAAAAMLLALGYLGFEHFKATKPGVFGAPSIAVLPLANESGDASQQYFSDGISEDLITALSQFPGLKVIGRSSAFKFRDSKEDSRSIGATLGVAHLLEGSVRKSGDMIRVSAELIDTTDGSTQWSERYDRPYRELFELQDEITRAVANALKTKLLPGEHPAEPSERPPSGNLDAYNALLEGRFYNLRNTEADCHKAIDFYTRAIELDPRYALAWSEVAKAWVSVASSFLGGTAAQEAYDKARAAIDRALELSPDLAAAHGARARLLQDADFDWHGAEKEFRRELALAPNEGSAKYDLGRQLAIVGQIEQGAELMQQGLAAEPLRPSWRSWLAIDLLALGRLDEAERMIRRAMELQPGGEDFHFILTMIEVKRGHAEAALAAAQQEPPGTWQLIALAFARQIGPDRAAADASLKTLIDAAAGDSAYQIAQVYALRNDATQTFAWLERAWSSRDPGLTQLMGDPFIRRYQADPRFAAFCRKIGLSVPGNTSAVERS